MKPKLKLRAKFIAYIIFLGLLVGALSVLVSYITYSNTMDAHYKTLTTNLADTAIEVVDRERVLKYVQTHEKDEEYDNQRELMRRLQKKNNVEYLYILELLPTQTVTIIDTDPELDLGWVDERVDKLTEDDANGMVYISNTKTYGWLCTAMRWIRDDAGKPFAVMCVDISMNAVMADRMHFLRFVIFVIIVAVALACSVITFMMNGSVIKPLRTVAEAAYRFVSDRRGGGDASDDEKSGPSAISRLDIHTGDEVEAVADALQTMELEINDYIRDLTSVTAEKERIGAELNVANRIQNAMLPSLFPPFPDRDEFDLFASMVPAKEVGGDFYDFFLVDDDHLALVIADVSGKGVPAALFMMISKMLIKTAAQSGMSPAAVLSAVNNQLIEGNDIQMFVTVWLGILEISTGKLTCANAGHEYPTIRHAGGAFELIHDKHGFVVGGMAGVRYREYTLQLEKGDTIFVYTDGVAEATNASEELFGTDRMLSALNSVPANATSRQLLAGVRSAIDGFVGDAPQFDDITMLTLDYRGK